MLAGTLAALIVASTAHAATLKADYQFQGTRDSAVAGAPSLVDLGAQPNVFASDSVFGQAQQVLTFQRDNGLQLSPASAVVSAGTYSIVILARLEQVASYARLVDFANATTDSGLYYRDGTLVLYPNATGTPTGVVAAGKYAQVTLTRDAAGLVIGYVNRTQVLGPYDDSQTNNALITADDVLRFFIDDGSVGGEDSAGAVARIRIYDAPLTADEVAALAPATPTLGSSEVAGVVRGTVRVKAPGGQFVTLEANQSIPVGSTVDTRKGTVALQSAVDAAGNTQTGQFSGGIFRFTQSKNPSARGLTTLTLRGGRFSSCKTRSASASRAVRTIRRLQGKAKGHYRTRGHYAAATVRGTVWTITDRCDGTLVVVKQGVVSVRDLRRHRTVSVRAGHRYLARP